MARSARGGRDSAQADLFDHPLFPVQRPADLKPGISFRAQLSAAIARALKQCPKTRGVIAAEISEQLGETVSEAMLNNYASVSHHGHDISVTRLKALARVTEAPWLWEVATEGDGLTIMQGEEAYYAQLGLALADERQAKERVRKLQALCPDTPRRRSRR